MKKSLFVSIVMLFVGMTVNAQDYKKQSFIPEAAMPDAGIYLPAPPDTASYQFDYDFRQYVGSKDERGQRTCCTSKVRRQLRC